MIGSFQLVLSQLKIPYKEQISMETFTNTESQLSENTTKKSNSMIEQENPAFYQALDFANEAILIYNKNQENIYQT